MVMETKLRDGLDLTMVVVAGSLVFLLVCCPDGLGAFTFYTRFHKASPPPVRTIGSYDLPTVPLVVKFSNVCLLGGLDLVMTSARDLLINAHDFHQILSFSAHNNYSKGFAGSRNY